MEFKRISIDTSKHIFTIHGVDGDDRAVLRRDLRRGQVEAFVAQVSPTEIALEACAGSHHWGRAFSAMGHRVKLIPPQYVKPFVKRFKDGRRPLPNWMPAGGGHPNVPTSSHQKDTTALQLY